MSTYFLEDTLGNIAMNKETEKHNTNYAVIRKVNEMGKAKRKVKFMLCTAQ